MSSKCRKTHLRPGLCPGPRWGSLQCYPRPHSWVWAHLGPASLAWPPQGGPKSFPAWYPPLTEKIHPCIAIHIRNESNNLKYTRLISNIHNELFHEIFNFEKKKVINIKMCIDLSYFSVHKFNENCLKCIIAQSVLCLPTEPKYMVSHTKIRNLWPTYQGSKKYLSIWIDSNHIVSRITDPNSILTIRIFTFSH